MDVALLFVVAAVVVGAYFFLTWSRKTTEARKEMKTLRQEILSVCLLSMTPEQKAKHKKAISKFNEYAETLGMERVPDFWEELGDVMHLDDKKIGGGLD